MHPHHSHPPPSHPNPGPDWAADVEQHFRDALLRTRRHWYEDGLAEIVIGAIFAVLGFYFAAQAAVAAAMASRPLVRFTLNLLLPLLVVAACLAGRLLIRRAKERFVYPRAGFVSYPQTGRHPRWLSGLIGGGVAALTVTLARRAPGVEAWIAAFQGFLLAGFFLWLGRMAGLPRFSFHAAVSVLTGLVVSLTAPASSVAAATFFVTVGLSMLLAGSVTFARFLKATPPPEDQ